MSELQDFIIKNGTLEDYRGSSEVVIIPEGVHTIDSFAFLSDAKENIKCLQFPESLEVIKDWAFDRCKRLTRIVIPANVKEIGRGAFNSCKILKDVVIEGNPTIGDGAFRWTQWEEDEFKKAGAQIKDDVLLRVHPELTEYIIPWLQKPRTCHIPRISELLRYFFRRLQKIKPQGSYYPL